MNDITKNGYVVLRNSVSQPLLELLKIALHDLVYFRIKNDEAYAKKCTRIATVSFGKKYAVYGELITETVLSALTDYISSVVGKKVLPTYSYFRIYEKGSNLVPHVDRNACEYSVTMPIFISDNKASSIYIQKEKYVDDGDYDPQKILEETKNKPQERIDLLPGDMLLYKGCEVVHWRKELESNLLIQLFLHYVDSEGPHASHAFDGRKGLFFQIENNSD